MAILALVSATSVTNVQFPVKLNTDDTIRMQTRNIFRGVKPSRPKIT